MQTRAMWTDATDGAAGCCDASNLFACQSTAKVSTPGVFQLRCEHLDLLLRDVRCRHGHRTQGLDLRQLRVSCTHLRVQRSLLSLQPGGKSNDVA